MAPDKVEEDPDDDMEVLPVSDVADQVEFLYTIDNVEKDHSTKTTSYTVLNSLLA